MIKGLFFVKSFAILCMNLSWKQRACGLGRDNRQTKTKTGKVCPSSSVKSLPAIYQVSSSTTDFPKISANQMPERRVWLCLWKNKNLMLKFIHVYVTLSTLCKSFYWAFCCILEFLIRLYDILRFIFLRPAALPGHAMASLIFSPVENNRGVSSTAEHGSNKSSFIWALCPYAHKIASCFFVKTLEKHSGLDSF